MAKNTPAKNQPTVDDLKAPLLAAVGAADLALERVNEIVATLRERAGEARTDAEARVEESRARLTKLQEDLPTQFGELRERLTTDELRKRRRKLRGGRPDPLQQAWSSVARPRWSGCAASPRSRRAASRVERYSDQAVELTQEALGNVASQTRAVGERAAKLVGVELPKKAQKAAPPRRRLPPRPRPRKRPPRRRPPRRLRPRRSPRSSNRGSGRPQG